jgi:hypothetical protein
MEEYQVELIIDTQFMVASFPDGAEWRYDILAYDVTCHSVK